MDYVEEVLKEVKKLGYETYSPTESIIQMQEEQARQQGQLFAIEFISLLVSAIGIANTMYANILERRSDIGVMKVLGMYFSEGMTVSIPLWLSGGAMLIAVGVGSLSGIYPAYKATKMSALEAVRN